MQEKFEGWNLAARVVDRDMELRLARREKVVVVECQECAQMFFHRTGRAQYCTDACKQRRWRRWAAERSGDGGQATVVGVLADRAGPGTASGEPSTGRAAGRLVTPVEPGAS